MVEVPVEGLVPGLVAHVADERESARAAGVGDEDVEAPEPLDGGVDQCLDIRLLLDITGEEGGAISCTDLFERLHSLGLAAAVDHHARAFREKRFRDGSPDTARSTGDDRHLSLQLHRADPQGLGANESGTPPGARIRTRVT